MFITTYKDGSLLVSDDDKGVVYRVAYTGSKRKFQHLITELFRLSCYL